MTDLISAPKPRKVLSLPIAQIDIAEGQPMYVDKREAVFMVWREGGDMPKRVYGWDEGSKAHLHARELSGETGARFHVLRSWRVLTNASGAGQ